MTSATVDIDPWAELGISPDAEPEVIEGAFRALARKYHPDVNPDGAERMKRINLAHDLLRDPIARQRWQSKRRPSGGRAAAPKPPRAEKIKASNPPPPPPTCPSCRQPVDQPNHLCSDCHTQHLRQRLWLSLTLFAVSFTLALAGLHVLWKAALFGYLIAAIPSGVDILDEVRDGAKYPQLSKLLIEPAPWSTWNEQFSWGATCAVVVFFAGAVFAPIDWASSLREL
jgi:DnaJ domain